MAKECFSFDWRDSTELGTWWLYEFATVVQGLNLDRSRLLGIHSWTTGLPLSCGQMQLLLPTSQIMENGIPHPGRPVDFRPYWMEGGEIVAYAEEVANAFKLLEQWKRIYNFRLGPHFLLAPGHKVYALERLLATENWVKARFSAATRVTGVRQLRKNGAVGPSTICELKGKQNLKITIGKLNGTSRTLELPSEAEKPDLWVGSWIIQMSNILWDLAPRKAALLVHHKDVLPPWTRLQDLMDF